MIIFIKRLLKSQKIKDYSYIDSNKKFIKFIKELVLTMYLKKMKHVMII